MNRPPGGAQVPVGSSGLRLHPAELCEGVSVVFTPRAGGMSAEPFATLNMSCRVGDDPRAVNGNRERVLAAIGPGPRRLAWMRQVHGTGVVHVADVVADACEHDAAAASGPEADAAFTDSPDIAVGVLAADCAPVLMADPAAGLIGAAHAGRPGMAGGVVPALVEAMALAGADPGRMNAIIGPSICGLCYEVPAEMRDEVAAAVPGSACLTRKGTPGLDLRAGLRGQLAALGIGRVSDDPRCTAESGELFSYRRDGHTGRFAGLIWLTP